MKKALGTLLVLSMLVPLGLQGQERSPELQKLDEMIGGFADTPDGKPDQVCSWVGDNLVQCPVFGEDGSVTNIHIMGYDAEAGTYTASRFIGSSGFSDTGRGWINGDTWTFIYGDNPSRIIRFTGTWESEGVWVYKWERSVEGGPWEETSGGKAYKVK